MGDNMDYIKKIRSLVGHEKIILNVATAIIKKDNQILVQKRSDNGLYSLPGGCMELDETLEDCVIREVKEETNLDVIPKRLVGIYHNFDMKWPCGDLAHCVNFVYECEIISGNIKIDEESLDISFIDIDKLPNMHTNDLNEALKDYLGGIKND